MQQYESGSIRFGEFLLTDAPLRLTRNGVPIRLRMQALRLLALLASRPGELFGHREIHDSLWPGRRVDYSGTVHVCIRQIRAALDDAAGEPRYVETAPRHGYRFVAAVHPVPARRSRILPIAVGAAILAVVMVGTFAALGERDAAPPVPADVRNYYLRGKYLLEQDSPDQVASSVRYFDQALAVDSSFVAAHVGLADAYQKLGDTGRARQHAEQALAIEPDTAEAHVHLAIGLMHAERDWQRAGRHLERALSLDPASARTRQVAAVRFAILGEMPQALAQIEAALRLDPVSTLIRADHGWMLYLAGYHSAAIESCGQALELEPRHVAALLCIERAASAKGDHRAAARAALRAMKLWGANDGEIAIVGQLPAAEVSRAFHTWRLRFYSDYPDQSMIFAHELAEANAAAGNLDAAMRQLERAAEMHSPLLPLVVADPVFGPLRDDARFVNLRGRLNL